MATDRLFLCESTNGTRKITERGDDGSSGWVKSFCKHVVQAQPPKKDFMFRAERGRKVQCSVRVNDRHLYWGQ